MTGILLPQGAESAPGWLLIQYQDVKAVPPPCGHGLYTPWHPPVVWLPCA